MAMVEVHADIKAIRPKVPKAKVTLTCPTDLVQKAKRRNINMSYALEQALKALVNPEKPK